MAIIDEVMLVLARQFVRMMMYLKNIFYIIGLSIPYVDYVCEPIKNDKNHKILIEDIN